MTARTNRGAHALAAVLVLATVLTGAACLANGGFTPVFRPEMEIGPATGRIVVDGNLDDPGWRDQPRAANFAEHNPGDQIRPPVDTSAMMTYDDEYLYVAWTCHDDPALVRATYCERDEIFQDDYVILCLDTFGDQAWAYEIACNPHGIQGDLLWSSNYGEDITYDVVFRSAGRITDDGWQVEMAIPFTSLKFPAEPEQAWRVDFWRNRPREVRGQYSWAAYDRDEQCWPCQWGTVRGLRGIEPGKGLEILPSVVGSQAGARNDDTGDWDDRDVTGEFGVGAAYDISNAFSAEGTYNPDFSQVESDAAQIDVNTTFALFFEERRPFFQEGSDLFHTNFNVVYTRSINDPVFAAKMIGRPGRTSVAYLVAQDDRTPFIIPLEERSGIVTAGRSVSNIVRAQHALGDNSYVGLVATDRRLEGGGAGTVLGADTRIRLNRNYQIEMQALATRTEEPDDPVLTEGLEGTFDDGRHTAAFDGERFWGKALYASLERSGRSTSFDVDYWMRSPTFRADNGYEFRNDRHQVNAAGGYTWIRENSFMDRLSTNVQVARVWNFDGMRKDEWASIDVQPRFQLAQSATHYSFMASNENFAGIQFNGIYQWHTCFNTTPTKWLNGGGNVNYGRRIARSDLVLGRETSWGVWFNLKPLDRLLISTSVDHIRSVALSDRYEDGERVVTDGQELFAGSISRTKITYQVTRELSTRLVLQYNDFDDVWEVDPLISFQLNPFSIFYAGSTRDYGRFTTGIGQPEVWRLAHRQYFMKLQYLFQI